jgi:hypothetical protein
VTQVIRGPSVTIIGWVPFAYRPPALRLVSPLGIRGWLGVTLVNLSGNARPPRRFRSHRALIDFTENRDFRGAVWVRDVELTVDSAGGPIDIDCDDNFHVGYTPYFAWVPAPNSVGRVLRRLSCEGEAEQEFERATTANGGRVRKLVGIRLGKVPNAVSRIVTGHWAPYAWMEIDYRLYTNGLAEVSVSGSSIPSQTFYVAGYAVGSHSMRDTRPHETRAFLQAGDRVRAPTRRRRGTRFTVPGVINLSW